MGAPRVLFVCLGNICRSPMAAAVLRAQAAAAGVEIDVASAGTAVWYAGEGADRRARAALVRRGYEDSHCARQFEIADFGAADVIVVMDAANERRLHELAPSPGAAARVRLLRSFDPAAPPGAEVPDPFHAGDGEFEECLGLIEAACRGLLTVLRSDSAR